MTTTVISLVPTRDWDLADGLYRIVYTTDRPSSIMECLMSALSSTLTHIRFVWVPIGTGPMTEHIWCTTLYTTRTLLSRRTPKIRQFDQIGQTRKSLRVPKLSKGGFMSRLRTNAVIWRNISQSTKISHALNSTHGADFATSSVRWKFPIITRGIHYLTRFVQEYQRKLCITFRCDLNLRPADSEFRRINLSFPAC